jgi:ribonucleoside-diphosphate reductase alpha chain
LIIRRIRPTRSQRTPAHIRELGLGYANLGALLMALGMPYDSDQGRSYAAAITALMTGEAYLQSARVAEQMGPFAGYAPNREPMLKVIERHKCRGLQARSFVRSARPAARRARVVGRRAQARHRGRLPQFAGDRHRADRHDRVHDGLRHHRHRARHRADQVQEAGRRRDAENRQRHGAARAQAARLRLEGVQEIVEYLDEHETIEGAPQLADAHLPVFDCAFKPRAGSRTIHYNGHIKMMGAVQPFISGAISKTINMPAEATVEEIGGGLRDRVEARLKAVAIYRDGSKRTQPLNTGKTERRRDCRKAAIAAAGGRMRGASCPTSAIRSRTSSISRATRATSRSACTRTARRAKSSSRCPSRARPSRA